jgi:hypothetical protein
MEATATEQMLSKTFPSQDYFAAGQYITVVKSRGPFAEANETTEDNKTFEPVNFDKLLNHICQKHLTKF